MRPCLPRIAAHSWIWRRFCGLAYSMVGDGITPEQAESLTASIYYVVSSLAAMGIWKRLSLPCATGIAGDCRPATCGCIPQGRICSWRRSQYWGELDSLGRAEQQAIATRMFHSVPQLVRNHKIDAISSYVPRCVAPWRPTWLIMTGARESGQAVVTISEGYGMRLPRHWGWHSPAWRTIEKTRNSHFRQTGDGTRIVTFIKPHMWPSSSITMDAEVE